MYEKCSTSCAKCKKKCKDYLEEYETKEMEELMQGNDRIPMKKHRGAYRRK